MAEQIDTVMMVQDRLLKLNPGYGIFTDLAPADSYGVIQYHL